MGSLLEATIGRFGFFSFRLYFRSLVLQRKMGWGNGITPTWENVGPNPVCPWLALSVWYSFQVQQGRKNTWNHGKTTIRHKKMFINAGTSSQSLPTVSWPFLRCQCYQFLVPSPGRTQKSDFPKVQLFDNGECLVSLWFYSQCSVVLCWPGTPLKKRSF